MFRLIELFPLPNSELQNLRSQRYDFQKLLLAQLASYRTKYARTNRFTGLIDQDSRVRIEANVGPIPSARFLAGADNNCLDDLPLLDLPVRSRLFHGSGHDIPETSLLAACPTQGQNHLQFSRARVICNFEHGS